MDYNDFLELRARGHSVFWMPGIFPRVPESVFLPFERKSLRFLTAATVYGRRRGVYGILSQRGIIDADNHLEHDPALITEFENAIASFNRAGMEPEERAAQAERVRRVRLALWHEYLRYISQFAGVISLPAYFKGFPGRVLEGILARCAVFICEVYDLGRQKKVFLPGEHIHYISKHPNEAELAQIVQVALDIEYRKTTTAGARDRAFAFCEASSIMNAIVSWAVDLKTPALRGASTNIIDRPDKSGRAKTPHIAEIGYESFPS
jgi:hypothetical protein